MERQPIEDADAAAERERAAAREADLKAEDADTAGIVARVQAGERELYGTVYTRYFGRLYSYMKIALRNDDDAEDATHDVFLKALEGIAGYEAQPGRPFRAWMFAIARNTAIGVLRERGRLEVTDPAELDAMREGPSEDDTELTALRWINDQELLLFIERLPLSQQQVIVLRYMLDMSGPQMATVLHKTPNEVRMLQHRAEVVLRDRLIALGRDPGKVDRSKWRGRTRQAVVLRSRRFALDP